MAEDNAFNRAPSNPYKELAEQNKDTIYGGQQQAAVVQPTSTQATQTSTVQPVQQPVSVPQPQPQPRNDMAMQQMQNQYQQLAAQYQQLQQQFANSTAKLADYEAQQRLAQMQGAVGATDFEDLATVDAEDAKKISDKVLGATNASILELRKELDEQRKMLAQNAQAQQQVVGQVREEQLAQEVLRVHPDFYEFQQTPEYQSFISQKDGLSSRTKGQRLYEEFQSGNTAYVIDMLNQFKGSRPSVQAIASVAPVQTPNYAVPASSPQESKYTLRDLNDLYQTRQISHDQFVEELKKLRGVNK